MTKTEAITFAQKFNWTAADAKKAFDGLDFKKADEQTLLLALVKFAGPELYDRQRKQAAHKGLVTKKTNYIEKIETDFANKVSEYEETLEKERSLFVGIIAGIYKFAKPLGLKDPWIETLLATYEGDKKDAA